MNDFTEDYILAGLRQNRASLDNIVKYKFGFDEYGFLSLPSDFTPTLPCNFWRDSEGEIQHDMDFASKYKNGTAIYVATTGNDTSGNGSESLPYRTLTKAVAVAIAGVDAKYTIYSSVPAFDRDECIFNQTVTSKTIAIISTTTDRALISANATYTWTLDGAGTYKATRSGVNNVTDLANKDENGLPVPLKNVPSLVLCQGEKNTWYADGTTVWVHRNDEAIPTKTTTSPNLGVSGVKPKVSTDGVIYFENFVFTPIESANALFVSQDSLTTAMGELCLNNCGFVGQNKIGFTANGIATQRIKNVYVFDCVSAYAQADGFNYHYETMSAGEPQKCFVLEYNCKAYDLALDIPGLGSNNVSSIHEGSNILRIGTKGHNNTGACIIDVNGCYSILYDCDVHTPVDSTTLAEGVGSCYSFTKDSGSSNKVYLINCKAADCSNALVIGSGTTAFVKGFDKTGDVVNNGTINYI